VLSSDDLFKAKVEVMSAFVNGPGIMGDAVEGKLLQLMARVEMEFEYTVETSKPLGATVTEIAHGKRRALPENNQMTSNTKINWNELVEWCKQHPGQERVLLYANHHTAVVTAGRNHRKFPEMDILAEHHPSGGSVTVSFQ
jgi:hypothetical protein